MYKLTEKEPFNKEFRFVDQIRASSGSVMDNIAEGFDRGGNSEFANFLYIARGSNAEVRSQAYRAFDRHYISNDEFEDLIFRTETLKRKITNLAIKLKSSTYRGFKYK